MATSFLLFNSREKLARSNMVCTLQCLIYRYTGNTTVKVGGICRQKRETCEYVGELDEKERPHGKGQAINP